MKKIVGIIGYPIGHTISPAMHNAAYRELGLNFEYLPFEVNPEDLPEALGGFRALHIAGFNVTIPHKEAIIPLLDEVTKLAELIGAVNTVENQEGRLVGYNTDGPGFIESLEEDAGFSPKGKNIVILGSGGASRAVSVMLAEHQAKTVAINDLIPGKANNLAEYLSASFNTKFRAVGGEAELQKALDKADLLVNASPIGMHPKIDDSPLPKKINLNSKLIVYDLVYNPAETKLLKLAKAAGAGACSGLGMLVRQGALAFTIFTGEEPPVETMWQAGKHALRLI